MTLHPAQTAAQREAHRITLTSLAAALLIGAWIYTAVWHGTTRWLG